MRPGPGRVFRSWAVVVVVALGLDQLAAYGYLRLASGIRSEALAADALVVFFGGEGDRVGLNDETRRRLAHAETLFREGRSGTVLSVGGSRLAWNRSGAERMREALIARGLPAAAVLADDGSHDTRTNLAQAFRFARARGWRSLTLVSSPVHMLRIRRLSRRLAGDGVTVRFDPYPYAAAEPPAGWPTVWRQVHYEWVVAILQALLPDDAYERFVWWWRN